MALLWLNNDLIVSSPSKGEMSLIMEGAGSLYYYKDLNTKKGDFNYLEIADRLLVYNLVSSRFGNTLHKIEEQGKVTKIAIGAPYANYFSEYLCGLVAIVDMVDLEAESKVKFLE